MLTLLEKIDLYLGEEVGGEGMSAGVGTITADIAPNPNKFVVGAAKRKKKKKKKVVPTD